MILWAHRGDAESEIDPNAGVDGRSSPALRGFAKRSRRDSRERPAARLSFGRNRWPEHACRDRHSRCFIAGAVPPGNRFGSNGARRTPRPGLGAAPELLSAGVWKSVAQKEEHQARALKVGRFESTPGYQARCQIPGESDSIRASGASPESSAGDSAKALRCAQAEGCGTSSNPGNVYAGTRLNACIQRRHGDTPATGETKARQQSTRPAVAMGVAVLLAAGRSEELR